MELSTKKIFVGFATLFGLGVALAFINVYHTLNIGCGFCPWIYVIAILGIATGGFIVLLFQWRINKIQLEKVLRILPDEEKKVMKTIYEKKEVTQTDLRHYTGLSKVRLSRILSKFEQQGAIEKRQHGNTNLIKTRI